MSPYAQRTTHEPSTIAFPSIGSERARDDKTVEDGCRSVHCGGDGEGFYKNEDWTRNRDDVEGVDSTAAIGRGRDKNGNQHLGQQLPWGEPEENHEIARSRRLRVGFLSAFFFHHSVGLLTQGVITRLDRTRFETTAIFLQPHPTTISEEYGSSGTTDMEKTKGDHVYMTVREQTEAVLDIPAGR